jgi:hypothetical protein
VSKERVLSRLEHDWQAFLKSFEGLPEEVFFEAGVCGEWSIRDIMAHVTTWEEEALKNLPLILERKRTPRYAALYGGIDAFNSLQQDKKRNLSLSQIKKDLISTHQRLIAFLSDLPESAFTTRFTHRLSIDTYKHYREHTEQIEQWKRKRGV